VADPGQHHQAGAGDGFGGGTGGADAQDGIPVAVQDEDGHLQLAQFLAVPRSADLPALGLGVPRTAVGLAVDPFSRGVLVERIGRGGDGAGEHERELDVALPALGKLRPGELGQQAEAHVAPSSDAGHVAGHGHGRHDGQDPVGVPERDPLSDHPAKRGAEDVRPFPAERVQHGDRIVGHVLGGVRTSMAHHRSERVTAARIGHPG